MTQHRLFINNEWTEAASSEVFSTIDPATEQEIGVVARGRAADVDRAVQAAKAAMAGDWSRTSAAQRGKLLFKLADLIEKNIDELARTETLDMGKPLSQARDDIGGVISCFRYNAGAADKIQGESIPVGADVIDFTLLEPVGVTGHIVPWNFPLNVTTRSLAPALAAGCTAVIKPAEQSPLSALRFCELVREAGIPAGVVNVVTGYGNEAGDALVRHPDVKSISFTGSVATGRKVLTAAAEGIKPAILELGGKNPMIVFGDADIERAVGDAVSASFDNSGQICSSASRYILHSSIQEEFLGRLEEKVKRLTIGPGMENPDIGPIVSAKQYANVMKYIDAGKASSARLRLGGGRPQKFNRGYFVEPTIFDRVDPSSIIAQEEIFGPVVVSISFDSEEAAMHIANNLGYGLVAAVYTRDVSRAIKFAKGLEAGSVWINSWWIGGVQAPVGGVKDSGIGRERGMAGLRNYVQIKNIGIRP